MADILAARTPVLDVFAKGNNTYTQPLAAFSADIKNNKFGSAYCNATILSLAGHYWKGFYYVIYDHENTLGRIHQHNEGTDIMPPTPQVLPKLPPVLRCTTVSCAEWPFIADTDTPEYFKNIK